MAPQHLLVLVFSLVAVQAAAKQPAGVSELAPELRQELCRAGDGMVAAGNLRGAAALYDSAARGGSGPAAFRIAMLHDRTGNSTEATLWWKKAAELGVATPGTACIPAPCATAPIPPC